MENSLPDHLHAGMETHTTHQKRNEEKWLKPGGNTPFISQ
jgi:hypothetical protein